MVLFRGVTMKLVTDRVGLRRPYLDLVVVRGVAQEDLERLMPVLSSPWASVMAGMDRDGPPLEPHMGTRPLQPTTRKFRALSWLTSAQSLQEV